MELRIDVPWILQVAEIAGVGDPAPEDYGVPVAAVACHQAELLDQPVYDGTYARAAATAMLERSSQRQRPRTWTNAAARA